MEELKWISAIGNVGYPLVLLVMVFYAFRMFMEKYPVWRAEDQKAKDARAEIYRKSMESLASRIEDVVKTSQEGTRVIQEALGKAADKQQERHVESMTCIGSIRESLNGNPRESPRRSGL